MTRRPRPDPVDVSTVLSAEGTLVQRLRVHQYWTQTPTWSALAPPSTHSRAPFPGHSAGGLRRWPGGAVPASSRPDSLPHAPLSFPICQLQGEKPQGLEEPGSLRDAVEERRWERLRSWGESLQERVSPPRCGRERWTYVDCFIRTSLFSSSLRRGRGRSTERLGDLPRSEHSSRRRGATRSCRHFTRFFWRVQPSSFSPSSSLTSFHIY